MVMEVARGERGPAPQTITFLSGDVHNSYLAEVTDPVRLGAQSRIVQAVCSPIRNPMPRGVRMVMSLFAKSLVRPMRFIARTSPDVPSPAYPWTVTDGPWFDNNMALVTVSANELSLDWYTGVVEDDQARPRLQQVYAVRLDPLPATVRVASGSVQG
jgi:hypothetical protein